MYIRTNFKSSCCETCIGLAWTEDGLPAGGIVMAAITGVTFLVFSLFFSSFVTDLNSFSIIIPKTIVVDWIIDINLSITHNRRIENQLRQNSCEDANNNETCIFFSFCFVFYIISFYSASGIKIRDSRRCYEFFIFDSYDVLHFFYETSGATFLWEQVFFSLNKEKKERKRIQKKKETEKNDVEIFALIRRRKFLENVTQVMGTKVSRQEYHPRYSLDNEMNVNRFGRSIGLREANNECALVAL